MGIENEQERIIPFKPELESIAEFREVKGGLILELALVSSGYVGLSRSEVTHYLQKNDVNYLLLADAEDDRLIAEVVIDGQEMGEWAMAKKPGEKVSHPSNDNISEIWIHLGGWAFSNPADNFSRLFERLGEGGKLVFVDTYSVFASEKIKEDLEKAGFYVSKMNPAQCDHPYVLGLANAMPDSATRSASFAYIATKPSKVSVEEELLAA